MDTFSAISTKLHSALLDISRSESPRLLESSSTSTTTPLECFFDVILQAIDSQSVTTPTDHIGYQLVYEAGVDGGGVLAFALVKAYLKEAAKGAEKAIYLLTSDTTTRTPAVDAYIVLRGTLLMLCMAPMRYTVWNMRKKALVDILSKHHDESQNTGNNIESGSKLLELVSYELTFINLVQSKWPKIPETWSHRQWVIRWMVASARRGKGESPLVCLRASLSSSLYKKAIFLSADRHPRNYPLWSGYMHPVTSLLLQDIAPVQYDDADDTLPTIVVIDDLVDEWIGLLESLVCGGSSYGTTHPGDVSFYTWITYTLDTLISKIIIHLSSQSPSDSMMICRLMKLAYRLYSLHTRQLLGVLATIDQQNTMSIAAKQQQEPICEKDDIVSRKSEVNRMMVNEGTVRVGLDIYHSLLQGALVIRRATLRTLCSLLRVSPVLLTTSMWGEVVELELSLVGYMLQEALLPHRSTDHPAMVADYNRFAVTELFSVFQVTR